MSIPLPPGVFDIVPQDPKEAWRSSHIWQYVEGVMREAARQYGYLEIRTPIFERAELFHRTSGESSDVVSKEMYAFKDKGDRLLSLRPEGTAPVMRALVEHQLIAATPIQRLFYIAPMFRYDRPQAGRYRQHHQFGVEAVGVSSPEQDVEGIDLLYTIYNRLGLKNLRVYINSLGDEKSREAFRNALKEYLIPRMSELSADSRTRLEMNPLRILDSKDPGDQAILKNAPSILDFLNEECKGAFEKVQKLLTQLKIPFEVNPLLVRGLDYYNKTVFEVVAGDLGAQNSVGGGGRYDGLLKELGGPDLPAFGFGTGLERVIQTMLKQEVTIPEAPHPTIYLIALGEKAEEACFSLLQEMRHKGISAQMDFGGRKLNKAMHYANLIRATYVVVMGDNELTTGKIRLKNMVTTEVQEIELSNLIGALYV